MRNISFEKQLKKILSESSGREKIRRMILTEAIINKESDCRAAYNPKGEGEESSRGKFVLACVYGCIPTTGEYKSGLTIPGQSSTFDAVVLPAKQPVGEYKYAVVAAPDPGTGSMSVFLTKDNTNKTFLETNQQGVTKLWYATKACGDLLPNINPALSGPAKDMVTQIKGFYQVNGEPYIMDWADGAKLANPMGSGWQPIELGEFITKNIINNDQYKSYASKVDSQRDSKAMVWFKGGGIAQFAGNRSEQLKNYWVTDMGYLDGRCPLGKGPNGEDPVDCQEYDLSNPRFNNKNPKDFTAGQYFVHMYRKKAGSDIVKQLRSISDTLASKGVYDKESCKNLFKLYVDAYDKQTQVSIPIMNQIRGAAQECSIQGYNYKTLGLIGGLDKKLDNLQTGAKVQDGYGNITDYSLSLNAGATELRESLRDRELKNLIRESLLDIKQTKKKINLGENKIINSRIKLISEHRTLKTKSQKEKFFNELMMEMAYLNSQGYDSQLINENFLDMLKGLFGTAADSTLQYFKESIARWLIEKLTPMDPNGWIANVIITGIGNVPIGEITRLTECNYLSDVLTKSIVEGTINKYKNEQGLTGPFYDILRNGVVEMLEDTKFGQTVEHAIGELVCPLLGGIKDKMGSAADTMKKGALSLT